MINKRLTYKRRLKHYNPGEETVVIAIPANDVFIRESDSPLFDFLAGKVADKLYAYEELGYEPEELHVIIKHFRALQEVYDSRPKDYAFDNFKAGLLQSCMYSYVMNDIKSTGEAWTALSKTIKNVIFNDPATIVFWLDGTNTVVICQEGDTFDPEKGLVMAIAKKFFGNKGNYCNEIKKWTEKYEEPKPVEIKLSIPNVRPCVEAFKKLNEQLKRHKKLDTDLV